MPATSDVTLKYAPASKIVRTLETTVQRQYAHDANSRILPPWARRVLGDAAGGKEFDVWIFSQALIQALSACTTRDGASTARAERARKVRHLAYWANAIIEKTLTGAEPVEGKTSPALQAARDQVQAAETEIHGLKMELAAMTEQNGLYVKQLGKTDETLAAYETIARQAEEHAARLAQALCRAESVYEYIVTNVLDDQGCARVLGYLDGRLVERGC